MFLHEREGEPGQRDPISPQEISEITKDMLPDEQLDGETWEQRRHRGAQMILEKLRKERDRFAKIFTTESGSVYFVTQTGESIRIKNNKGFLEVQPVTARMFFIDHATAEALTEELRKVHSMEIAKAVVGRPIRTVPFGIDTTPVELGLWNNIPIATTEEGDTITILGNAYNNNSTESLDGYAADGKTYREIQPGETFVTPYNLHGFHIGHKITQIEKG